MTKNKHVTTRSDVYQTNVPPTNA